MVAWCNKCGALLGVRVPFYDWTTDRTSTCPSCVEQQSRSAMRAWVSQGDDYQEDATLEPECAQRGRFTAS